MRRTRLLVLAVLVACDASPTGSQSGTRLYADHRDAPIIVHLPPQIVDVELSNGGTVEGAFFNGRLLTSADLRDEPAAMDGAILVVSAADGPMPSQPPDRWVQAIYLIRQATRGSDGTIRFVGVATLRTPAGARSQFDVWGAITVEASECRACRADISITGDADYVAAAGPARWRPQVSLFDVGDDP